MSGIIKTKRVVVLPNGEEFDNPSAFERHRIQSERGAALTRIAIKRADAPLVQHDEADT